MRILCAGGGPGGLYSALLLKKDQPSHEITVVDRNPPDATYGWGVVFSDETLGFLEDADADSYEAITRAFVHWEAIDIVYRGENIRSGGHAFSGMSRKWLLSILQGRCAELGIDLRFQTEIADLEPLSAYDLVIASDGVNSQIRSAHAKEFQPSFDRHRTKFMWLGCELELEAFTFDFRRSEYGMFQIHSYPFDRRMSTVIVECTESTWREAGLDAATTEQSISFCEQLFSNFLHNRPLLSNRSTWINFVTLKNATWRNGNTVLLGDAAHTAHFSIGSGTKMAMEDAIALTDALRRHPADLDRALVEYEELREPVVERTQLAARDSSLWFENVDRYAGFEPTQFAFSLLTRSKRVTYDNLKLRDVQFSFNVDRWFATQESSTGKSTPGTIQAPVLNALQLRSLTLCNRVALCLPFDGDAHDGCPGDFLLSKVAAGALDGTGLVLTDMVAVSPGGRITPESPGLYSSAHMETWDRLVSEVHRHSNAKIALQLGHAGRRGATRPRREGADLPLREDAWCLVSASAIPYTRWSQTPAEMHSELMQKVCDAFVRSTRFAHEAGFDALQLNFGHGYLLASFLSPLTNVRRDDFGGPIGNRLRYPLKVFNAVRAAWPEEKPLFVRISATDWARGGISEEDVLAIASALKAHGCDLIDVVTGQSTSVASPPFGRAWQTPYSDLTRNEVGIATMTSGHITTSDEVNTILAAGRADLCIVAPRQTRELQWLMVHP